MANLHGDLPVEQRRKLWVTKKLREGLKGIRGDEDRIRVAAGIAIRSIQEFDRNEYAHDWLKFVDSDQADATSVTLMLTALQAGAEAGQEWCDTKHEQPKTCSCDELLKVVTARAPAVKPMLIDEVEEQPGE